MFNITLLKTAHIKCADTIIFKNGDPQKTTVIGCHAFLIEKGGEYFLIDTGIEDLGAANKTKTSQDGWSRGKNEFSITENLERVGVSPDKITKVFFTHSHYDHISGAVHFENAKFYMSKAERALLYSPNSPFAEQTAPAREFLRKKTVVAFDKDYEEDGIRLVLRGGHTAGSMSVELCNMLFVGDTIFTQENLKRKIPAGLAADRETADKLLESYLNYGGKIITSHDFTEAIPLV